MSVAAELRKLELRRDGELAQLCSRFAAVAGALEREPVRLIQQHPYLSTGGAALMGFAAAQIAMRSPLPAARPHPPTQAASPPISAPAAPARSVMADLLPLMLELAGQFLPLAAGAAAPATFTGADAGVVRGEAFPQSAVPARSRGPVPA